MAGALGATGRRMWRRRDLSDADAVIMDLVAEALQRISLLLRPCARAGPVAALALAPAQVQEECRLLLALARPLLSAPSYLQSHQSSQHSPSG